MARAGYAWAITGREAAATREAAKKLRRENDIAVPLPQQFERRNGLEQKTVAQPSYGYTV
jgi:hypothetical protein